MYKITICLIAVMLLISGCGTHANSGSSPILEFFGFNRPTDAPVSTPADQTQNQKAQNQPVSDDNPFGAETQPQPQTGSSLSDMDIDIDPALIDFGDTDIDQKSETSASQDGANDPTFWSFSEEKYQQSTEDSQQKYPYGPNPYSPAPVPVNPRPAAQPPYNFYRIQDCPVFCPMRELPRTGFSTRLPVEIKESINYAATNMSLTIPRLNVKSDIVVVPLVDNNFPVESLGENVGLLEGSGAGSEDLFVLAGHNHLNAESKGPFVELSALQISDLIFVSGAKDASRTFVVYANELFASEDIEGLISYAKPGCMILITCEDESIDGGYLNRRVIFAEAKED